MITKNKNTGVIAISLKTALSYSAVVLNLAGGTEPLKCHMYTHIEPSGGSETHMSYECGKPNRTTAIPLRLPHQTPGVRSNKG